MNIDEHRRLRELLGAFALDQLSTAERTAVQAHLDGCAACRAELAAIAPLAGPLGLIDPARLDQAPAGPPDWLETSILTAIRAEPRRIRSRGRWLLSAAAAVVIGGAGAAAGYAVAPDPPKIPLEPVQVTAIAAGVRSTAAVVPHTWGMEIKLAGTGFEAGKRYHVVVLDEAGRIAPAGEFIGTGAKSMSCNLNSSVLRPDAAAFEVLDETDQVVLRGQV
ncbi:anti-sigma factor family protein [Kribbella sp. CA-293567]|uniref:anti-sigma factor family protein n=1 Tax=Kribbella sp. CA-293567 TaxID=3002436 RepID=UPI0022DD7480|nr:zf-HC2 domain-containing protein [Kribbella sp. CA-293567]WBQ07462.1 zf-HC2 domain-containing protein [Kribbella sp. CA-293567]